MTKLKLLATTLVALSLSEESTPEEVDKAVVELSNKNKALEKELEDYKKQSAETLVDDAIKQKKIKASDKDKFVTLALKDFKLASETLGALPSVKLPNEQINPKSKSEHPEGWTLKDWREKDPKGLKELKNNDPDKYKELAQKAVEKAKESNYN